jgi:hypothetical protein
VRARPSPVPIAISFGPLLLAACGGGDLLLPGGPALLRLVSGDLQEAEAGARLPNPLVVAVEDATGRPVSGSRILFRFELASDGGEVNPDTVQTDSTGQATATVRLGDDPGAHPVEATVVDATGLRVRFILTALTPEPPANPETPGNGGNGGSGGNGGGGAGGGGGGGPVDGGGDNGDDGGGGGGGGGGHGHGGKGGGGKDKGDGGGSGHGGGED